MCCDLRYLNIFYEFYLTYWTSESDRFYGFTFVRMDVWMYVRNELISETAQPIFLKLGMKLGNNKGKKIARPDFW